MKPIKIRGTEDTPDVILDATKGLIEFSGRSLPEDVLSFYAPVLRWLEDYIKSPNSRSEVIFKLDYFNTASSKIILDILIYFEHLSNEGKDVIVKWFYHKDDEDMADAGVEYFEIVNIPYEMHSY